MMPSASMAKSSSHTASKVQAKAGKCNYDGSWVTADKRKGYLSIFQLSRGYAQIEWGPRNDSGMVVSTEDKITVHENAYLERVPECTSGRVYVLRFTSGGKQMLFWMQEPNEAQDAEFLKKFNAIAKGRPRRSPTPRPRGPLGSKTPGSTGTESGAPSARALQQAANYAKLMGHVPLHGSKGGVSESERGQKQASVALRDVLTYEVMSSLLDDPVAVNTLQQCMPDTHRSEFHIRNAMLSPQLRSGMDLLTAAIYCDELPVLLPSLGLTSASFGEDNFTCFIKALNKSEGADNGAGPTGSSGGKTSAAARRGTEEEEPPCKVSKTATTQDVFGADNSNKEGGATGSREAEGNVEDPNGRQPKDKSSNPEAGDQGTG